MKQVAKDATLLAGFGCVVSAAFLVALPLGLVVLGVPLMALALWEKRDVKKGDRKC